MTARRVRFDHATHEVALELDPARREAFVVRDGERAVAGARRWVGARLELELPLAAGSGGAGGPAGRAIEAHVTRGARGVLEVWIGGERVAIEEARAGAGSAAGAENGEDELVAPMPAKIVRVLVAAGDAVEAGQTLVVLESMKMELSVTAPRAGTVHRVGPEVAVGAIVAAGTTLIELVPPAAA